MTYMPAVESITGRHGFLAAHWNECNQNVKAVLADQRSAPFDRAAFATGLIVGHVIRWIGLYSSEPVEVTPELARLLTMLEADS